MYIWDPEECINGNSYKTHVHRPGQNVCRGAARDPIDIVFHAPQLALEHILTFFLFNLAACDQALTIAHHGASWQSHRYGFLWCFGDNSWSGLARPEKAYIAGKIPIDDRTRNFVAANSFEAL